MALTQKVSMKKLKTSRDQPRKQAMKVFRWTGVSLRKWPMNSIEAPQRNSSQQFLRQRANYFVWVVTTRYAVSMFTITVFEKSGGNCVPYLCRRVGMI